MFGKNGRGSDKTDRELVENRQRVAKNQKALWSEKKKLMTETAKGGGFGLDHKYGASNEKKERDHSRVRRVKIWVEPFIQISTTLD